MFVIVTDYNSISWQLYSEPGSAEPSLNRSTHEGISVAFGQSAHLGSSFKNNENSAEESGGGDDDVSV